MRRSKAANRRTRMQVLADEASTSLMRKLGTMLRDGRRRFKLTQAESASKAGISRSEWSGLELGRKSATVATWNRAAFAVGGSLEAWIKETSAADQPRDAVHLKAQNLIVRLSAGGAWTPLPEELIDRGARTSRAADVLLHRASVLDGVREYAIWDVRDWIDDAGWAVRDFGRRLDTLERFAIARMGGDEPLPRTGGVFVVRATVRNRRLVHDHRHFFAARFPGSAHAWLRALQDSRVPFPRQPALVWVSVNGERLYAARLG